MGAKLNYQNDVEARESPEEGGKYTPELNSDSVPQAGTRTSRVTALDRWMARKMLDVVHNPPIVLRLWDGKAVTPPVEDPIAVLQYHDRGAMLKSIVNPELYFGDLYSTGRVSLSGDLVRFSELIYVNLQDFGRGGWLRKLILWLGHRRIANSTDKARDNIHHHCGWIPRKCSTPAPISRIPR